MTQPTVSKHWRRVVSHPDRPQSNQAHRTMLQYYNMHADIIQENNLTYKAVSELSEIKPNLVDRTCKLLKWLCNYRKLHNTTTREQFWQYSLLLLTKIVYINSSTTLHQAVVNSSLLCGGDSCLQLYRQVWHWSGHVQWHTNRDHGLFIVLKTDTQQ